MEICVQLLSRLQKIQLASKIRITQNILMTKYCEGTKDTIPECHNNIPTILSRKLFMLYSQSDN